VGAGCVLPAAVIVRSVGGAAWECTGIRAGGAIRATDPAPGAACTGTACMDAACMNAWNSVPAAERIAGFDEAVAQPESSMAATAKAPSALIT